MNRWIRGGSDSRYVSNLDINWHEVKNIVQKLPRNKIQGIGLLNFNKTETNTWKRVLPFAQHVLLEIEYADKNVTWDSLYPEWIAYTRSG